MVWTDSTEVGCGEAAGQCPTAWGVDSNWSCYYQTCRYTPPGNSFYVGQREEGLIEHVKPQIPAVTTQAAQITSRTKEEDEEEFIEAIL
jgi:hypothetical protein